MAETDLFKRRHYESEIILLCVRWYLRYALSYRDLEEMMNERGLSVDHTTIYRWVPRSAIIDDTFDFDANPVNATKYIKQAANGPDKEV